MAAAAPARAQAWQDETDKAPWPVTRDGLIPEPVPKLPPKPARTHTRDPHDVELYDMGVSSMEQVGANP